MECLVPIFIELMMDNPDIPLGAPYYPIVDDDEKAQGRGS